MLLGFLWWLNHIRNNIFLLRDSCKSSLSGTTTHAPPRHRQGLRECELYINPMHTYVAGAVAAEAVTPGACGAGLAPEDLVGYLHNCSPSYRSVPVSFDIQESFMPGAKKFRRGFYHTAQCQG